MKLPVAVTVGMTKYSVEQPLKMKTLWRRGELNYVTKVISVAKRSNMSDRLFSSEERCDTMWHELVHAALYDMGNPLHRDEDFVTALSVRLSGAVANAEF